MGPARHGSFSLMKWELRGDNTSDSKMWGEEKKYLHAWHVSSINKYKLAMSNFGLEIKKKNLNLERNNLKKLKKLNGLKVEGAAFTENKSRSCFPW